MNYHEENRNGLYILITHDSSCIQWVSREFRTIPYDFWPMSPFYQHCTVYIYIYILYVHSGQIIIIHWSEIRLLIGIVTPTNHHYSENSEVVIICPISFYIWMLPCSFVFSGWFPHSKAPTFRGSPPTWYSPSTVAGGATKPCFDLVAEFAQGELGTHHHLWSCHHKQSQITYNII